MKKVSYFRTHHAIVFIESAKNGMTRLPLVSKVRQKKSGYLLIQRGKDTDIEEAERIGVLMKEWERLRFFLSSVNGDSIAVREVTYLRSTAWKSVEKKPCYLPISKLSMANTITLEGWSIPFAESKEVSFGVPWSASAIPAEWERLDAEMENKGIPLEVRREVHHLATMAREDYFRDNSEASGVASTIVETKPVGLRKMIHIYRGSGYVDPIDTWGSDQRIIETARMSTDGAFRGWGTPRKPGDEKLLAYLKKNRHDTPFEFCGMTVEMKVPIFVIRQIMRHRAFGYNEQSARYVELGDETWLFEFDDLRLQGGSNRQGSVKGEGTGWKVRQKIAAAALKGAMRVSSVAYRLALRLGVSREQARVVLPVAQMTRCRMTGNLRSWLHFLSLRLDAHAQPETREFAEAIYILLADAFPRTIELFDKEQGHE